MAQIEQTTQIEQPAKPISTVPPAAPPGTFLRVAKYTAARLVVLLLTVVVAVYLMILIANLGGFVDEMIRADIHLSLMGMVQGGWLQDVPQAERDQIILETVSQMEAARGLNDPFLLRCLWWLRDGLTLNWGSVSFWTATGVSAEGDVRNLVMQHLARSLFLFGTANLFLFFSSILLSLGLTRRYGNWVDKLVVVLSPLSSAPAWVYGIILKILFLRFLSLSLTSSFDIWPEEMKASYLPILIRYLTVPFLAIVLSGLFQSLYAWRTFFLIYSQEDYVEMARAKGLPEGRIRRRYILRPALPGILTSFALLMVGLWQEIIALEYFFNVAGIGRLFIGALRAHNTPMIVSLVVTFAYLLAITIFILDISYALVDPRVKIGGESRATRSSYQRAFWKRLIPGRRKTLQPAGRRSPQIDFRVVWHDLRSSLTEFAGAFKETFRELIRYPGAVVGMVIIAVFLIISVYTVIAIPYREAISLWRGDNQVWERNPRNAPPVWINNFRKYNLPETIILDSHEGEAVRVVEDRGEGRSKVTLTYTFDYPYQGFPQDIILYVESIYDEKAPHVTMLWIGPTGEEVTTNISIQARSTIYYFDRDERLIRKLGREQPREMLFLDPDTADSEMRLAQAGTYQLQLIVQTFEENTQVDAELVIMGEVHGLAGTDADRRDLMIGLLWGTPIAMGFGLVAAVLTSFSSMFIAALGAWFGGWVDGLVQRITEVNMILPFFPVSLMIYILYSKSILMILGVTVLLCIFGHTIKTYRAIFLQIKEAPYIEAARSYGASDGRIIFRYLVPRIVSVLVPQLVILVPGYVFLEATLAFLGVSDPVLPTWGKLVVAALSYGAYQEAYHLVLAPFALLLLTGFAFALIGFGLEQVFEPRLRES